MANITLIIVLIVHLLTAMAYPPSPPQPPSINSEGSPLGVWLCLSADWNSANNGQRCYKKQPVIGSMNYESSEGGFCYGLAYPSTSEMSFGPDRGITCTVFDTLSCSGQPQTFSWPGTPNISAESLKSFQCSAPYTFNPDQHDGGSNASGVAILDTRPSVIWGIGLPAASPLGQPSTDQPDATSASMRPMSTSGTAAVGVNISTVGDGV